MTHLLTRRAFLGQGSLVVAAPWLLGAGEAAEPPQPKPAVRVGLVTDLHYADRPPAGNRYYRETPAKLDEAFARFRQEKTDVVVEMGDLIDAAESVDAEKGYLRRMVRQFRTAPGQPHFVLGNHCVYTLTKAEFLEVVGRKESYYSFDAAGFHFIILDACFRPDGTPYGRKNFTWTDASIPPAEAEWLREDLRRTPHKSLVFVHQRVDAAPPFGIGNGPEIRRILEASGKVLAVLQGHHHRGDYQRINGIAYATLTAMVEGTGPANSAFAVMDVSPQGTVAIRGFRRQRSYVGQVANLP